MKGPLGFDAGGGGTGVLTPPKPRLRRFPEHSPRERDSVLREPGGPPPPPEEPGDSGGGGWHGDEPDRTPHGPDVHRFALALAMAGISTLFAVFLVVWFRMGPAEPSAAPGGILDLPGWVWVSTLALLASSFTLHRALRGPARIMLVSSLALGLLFLISQALFWWRLVERGLIPASGGTMASFYAVTGLHALHVCGGLLVMARTTRRALALRDVSASIRLCAAYWHFMGVVWIVIFAVFVLAN